MLVRALLLAVVCSLACSLALAQDDPGSEGGKPAASTEPAPPSPPAEVPPADPSASPVATEPSPAPAPETVQTPAPDTAQSPAPEAAQSPAPEGSPAPEANPVPSVPRTASTSPGPLPERMPLREGDMVAGIGVDNMVKVMKVLKISWVNGERILHVMTFKEVFKGVAAAKEAVMKRGGITIELLHMLVYAEGLSADANKVIANQAVTEQDLEGYREYVKETSR